MGNRIFTMRHDDCVLEFGDVEVDQSEPNEVLIELDEDTWLLSPWAMRYIGDEGREQSVIFDALFSFWVLRGNSFFTERTALEIQGIIRDHPDFPEGVRVTLPFKRLVRAVREGVETCKHSIMGSETRLLAHDLIEATTPNGLKIAFYSDESLFRLGETYTSDVEIIV